MNQEDVMETMKLPIEGMSCGGCVVSVEKALGRVRGVDRVRVSLDAKEAEIHGTGLNRAALVAAVEDAGYDVPAA